MKRSEKIEVRVSHEEKSALSSLAHSEGQTISETVRGLMRGRTSVGEGAIRKNGRIWFASGLALVSVAIGAFAFGLSPSSAETYEYYVEGSIGEHHFGFAMDLASSETERLEIGSGYIVSAAQAETGKVGVSICLSAQAQCVQIANSSLWLDPKYPSVWQTFSSSGEFVSVSVQKLAG